MSIIPHIDTLKSKLLGRDIGDGLHVEEYLTHGTFGAIFRVADCDDARQLVLKVTLKSSHWEDESTLHYFLSNHPNIVTLHENIDFGDYAASLLDYCSGGSLHDLIYDHREFAGDSTRIKSTLLQIIGALEHCHTNYVYHRDLKPLNILCNEDGSQVFLTDFGLATRHESSREHSIGTVAYMSPGIPSVLEDVRVNAYLLSSECYREKHSSPPTYPYSPEANDVWSLGVLFLDLACGDRIWDAPCDADARYREFNADPSAFLRAEYPLNHRTRHLLLRILSPQPLRIPLKALREEISSIDDFYLPDHEIANSTAQVQGNAMRYGPWTGLVDGLGGLPHGDSREGLFTDSNHTDSTGEFVDVDLATPENEPSHFHSEGFKVEEHLAPFIADLRIW